MPETLEQFGSLLSRAVELAKAKHGCNWLNKTHHELSTGAFALLVTYLAMADDDGIVHGGRPIPDADLAEEFGRSIPTVQKWRNLLAAHGYVGQERKEGGWVITLKK